MVSKAMIMAAGVGSRLDPLTQEIPKPLVPIANCPMGEFQLELKENNFHVLGHKLEMYGYCDACYSVLRNDR